jgi:hypothetical protein
MTDILANNNSKTYDIFNQRLKYKRELYPNLLKYKIYPIDFWYEKKLYGRVDQYKNSIFLSETNLKQFDNISETIFCVDFVVDSFNDFIELMKKGNRNGAVINRGPYFNIEPKRGWENINVLYHAHMEQIYKIFTTSYIELNENRKNKIFSFVDFVKEFKIFGRDLINNSFPITHSQFVVSNYSTPLISGLIIEIQKEKHDNDTVKVNKYLNDPNFDFYVNSARKFGFIIDKNAPWRLVSDVTSPKTHEYMKKYGINIFDFETAGDIFDTYYYKSSDYDVEFLITYLIQFYNSYVRHYPYIKKSYLDINSNNIKTDIYYRKEENEENLRESLDVNFWIELYYYFRLLETNSFNPSSFKKDIKKIFSISKYLDKIQLIDYINSKISKI